MSLRKPALVAAGAAAAVLASAAVGAPVPTGTWSGKTSQDLTLTEEPWSVRITITALNGRLQTIATSIRMECPDPAVRDIRILKSFRTGAGPRLGAGGGFTVRVSGATISGRLGLRNASGRFDASQGGCSGKGSWKAVRRI